jgi:hypothetical protein
MTVPAEMHRRAAGNGAIFVQRRAVSVTPRVRRESVAWEALTSTALLLGAMIVSGGLLLYVVYYVLTALYNILRLAELTLTSPF